MAVVPKLSMLWPYFIRPAPFRVMMNQEGDPRPGIRPRRATNALVGRKDDRQVGSGFLPGRRSVPCKKEPVMSKLPDFLPSAWLLTFLGGASLCVFVLAVRGPGAGTDDQSELSIKSKAEVAVMEEDRPLQMLFI
jgi:hypothetical protein